ncbi:MAG: hypothetical protein HYR63_21565 [Proteobacteria bacterium]|nr:hypothetical protein [Pseudomonadota bacterium]MBI3496767.1 hypothetical protein [Pseudomonadota bacterium]
MPDTIPKLGTRLALLAISEDTKAQIATIRPLLAEEMGGIIRRFYRHIRGFPEGKRLIQDDAAEARLSEAQKRHWDRLFSCRFDEDYVASALRVGRAHLSAGVAPYVYIAGYNFFLCELINLIVAQYAGGLQVFGTLTAVSRIVYLDMDLALSTYTRELWRIQTHNP